MAIDTRAKRMSMLSFASPLAWGAHWLPDGSVKLADRKHLLHLYGGQLIGDAPVMIPQPQRIVRHTGRYV